MSDERREFFRFSTSWRARVLLSDRSLFQVAVRDVSKGGVAIDFHEVLGVNTPVNIELIAPYHGQFLRIRAKTVVAHNTVLSDGRSARLGLRFTEMSKETAHSYNNILQDLTERHG